MYLNDYIPMIGYICSIIPPVNNVYDILEVAEPVTADPHRIRIRKWIFRSLNCIRKRAAARHQFEQIVYIKRRVSVWKEYSVIL